MNNRKKIKKLLKELDLTSFKDISQIMLNLGLDKENARQFLYSIVEEDLIKIKHNGDINYEQLSGEPVLLKNIRIWARMTTTGEIYLHQNLTLFEKIISEWWKLILVSIPGLIIGGLIGFYISNF